MNQLETAAGVLKKGGIVIYPTETVYALGCLLSLPKSIEKLYEIKHRDANQPTAVLVKDWQQAREYVKFPQDAVRLAEAFWPGPLTLCLPLIKDVPGLVLGPSNTLGLRVPGSAWARELVSAVGEPILAPSANFKGEKPAAKYAEIDKTLIKLVDYVVDIEPEGQKPSTIVLFNDGKGEIIREGAIAQNLIFKTLEKEN